jgi:hypothetical protein
MKLAVLQPAYLPDPHFFLKMRRADVLVFGDNLQYSTRSNLNRTRIKTARGAEWLTVAVKSKGCTGQSIKNVMIDGNVSWRRHLRTLEVNYNATPYFDLYMELIEDALVKPWHYLIDLNLFLIAGVNAELGITTPIRLLSEFSAAAERTQKVIDLLRILDCDTYVMYENESALISAHSIRDAGFKLDALTTSYAAYHQRFGDFIPGLSVIDIMMNEGPSCLELFK